MRAQRNPVHSPAGSDLTCVSFSSLPRSSPRTRACVRACAREMRVSNVGVCAAGLSLSVSLSLSDVHAPVGGSKRTFRCFPQERQNHDGDGEKMPSGGSEMSSNLPSHFLSSAKTKPKKKTFKNLRCWKRFANLSMRASVRRQLNSAAIEERKGR